MNGVSAWPICFPRPSSIAQHEFVEIVRNSGDALLFMISDILDLAKVDSGTSRSRTVAHPLIGTWRTAGRRGPVRRHRTRDDHRQSVPWVVRATRAGPSGPLEPPGQRHQVHRSRRGGRPGDQGDDWRLCLRGSLRGTDSGEGIAPDKFDCHLPALRPGRHLHVSTPRRDRAGTGHQRPTGDTHGWGVRGLQPAVDREHLLVHGSCRRRAVARSLGRRPRSRRSPG